MQRKYEEAVKEYTTAIELDTTDPYAYYMRSWAFKGQGKPGWADKSKKDYEKACELDETLKNYRRPY